MNQIKAIETTYRGYRFRSRLEARWAVFFDTLGIPWKYEVQGYEREVETESGVKTARYLPDFFLPARYGSGGLFVEVKGDKNALKTNWWGHVQMHDFGGMLPNFHDSFGKDDAGLLLLSDIPEANPQNIYFHPVLQHIKGLVKSYAFFTDTGVSVVKDSTLAEILSVAPVHGLDGSADDWVIDTKSITANRHYQKVVDAYAAARGARFEHGESGNVTSRY